MAKPLTALGSGMLYKSAMNSDKEEEIKLRKPQGQNVQTPDCFDNNLISRKKQNISLVPNGVMATG